MKFYDEDEVLQLNEIELFSNLANYDTENYRESFVIPTCSNVKFTLDQDPPYTQLAAVEFDLVENGQSHNYSIDVAVQSWAGHLLSLDGAAIVTDDDDGPAGSGSGDDDEDEIDPNDKWEIKPIEPIEPIKPKSPKPPIASPWM